MTNAPYHPHHGSLDSQWTRVPAALFPRHMYAFAWLLGSVFVSLYPLAAAAETSCTFDVCAKFHAQKAFKKTARCFLRCWQKQKSKADKGRFLRNGILALESAAKKSRIPRDAALLRHEALGWIKRHDKEVPYEYKSQEREFAQKRRALIRLIKYASMTIVSNHPRAKICVSGGAAKMARLCTTARVWALAPLLMGVYQVQVAYPMRPPMTSTKVVRLPQGQKLSIVFDPPYVPLQVVTNDPNAQIEVKGRLLPTAYVLKGTKGSFRLPLGRYIVAVRYPNHPTKRKVVALRQAQPAQVVFTRPPPSWVQLKSNPKGSSIQINQLKRGVTPLRIRLRAGVHKLELRKACFLPVTRKMKVRWQAKQKAQNLTFSLKRDPVWLLHQNANKRRSLIGWVALGVGAGFAGAAAVALGVGRSQMGAAQTIKDTNPVDGFDEYQEKASAGSQLSVASYVGFGLGAAAIGLGLGYLLSASQARALPCQVRASKASAKPAPTRKAPARKRPPARRSPK